MQHRRLNAHCAICLILILLCSYPAVVVSSGLQISENSVSGLGRSFAGASAYAEDASIIYYNPAALPQLRRSQILFAGHFVSPNVDFKNNNSSLNNGNAISGNNDYEVEKRAYLPNIYWAQKINKAITAGFGINTPYGALTEYDDDWVGRYHGVKSQLTVINLNPSIGFRLTKNLSMGAGMNFQYANVNLTSIVDFSAVCSATIPQSSCENLYGITPESADGFVDINGDGWTTGYNLGMTYNFANVVNLGLAYRSKVEYQLEGDAKFKTPSEAQFILDSSGLFTNDDVTAELNLPASLSGSAHYQVNHKLALLADVTWTQWSTFEEIRIRYLNNGQPDSVTTTNWNDVFRYALGIQYQLNKKLLIRAGTAIDKSPTPNAEFQTPRVPNSDRYWFSTGIGYKLNKQLSLDVAYAHIISDTADINTTFESSTPTLHHTLIGEYDTTFNIVSAQMVWRY